MEIIMGNDMDISSLPTGITPILFSCRTSVVSIDYQFLSKVNCHYAAIHTDSGRMVIRKTLPFEQNTPAGSDSRIIKTGRTCVCPARLRNQIHCTLYSNKDKKYCQWIYTDRVSKKTGHKSCFSVLFSQKWLTNKFQFVSLFRFIIYKHTSAACF